MTESNSAAEAITVDQNRRTRRRVVIGGLAGLGGVGLGLADPRRAQATTFADTVVAQGFEAKTNPSNGAEAPRVSIGGAAPAIKTAFGGGDVLIGTPLNSALADGRQGKLVIGPHQNDGGYMDATAGGEAAVGAKNRVTMNTPWPGLMGWRNGVNTFDDTRIHGVNVIQTSTYWFPGTNQVHYFESKGLLTAHQVSLSLLKPVGTTAPNNYNEAVLYVGGVQVKNKGSMGRPFEGGCSVYQNDPLRTLEASYHADGGPAQAQALGWFSLNEHNPYSAYNDDAIFSPLTFVRNAGSCGAVLYSAGTRRGGTGLLLETSAGAGVVTDAAIGEAGWVRGIVMRDNDANDIFCLDGFGRIGLGVTRNQTSNTAGLPAKLCFAPGAGVAADGMNFGGDTSLWRSAVGRLTLSGAMNVLGSADVTQMVVRGFTPQSIAVFQVQAADSSNLFYVGPAGHLGLRDGAGLVLGTTGGSGVKIGTATTQKMAFWNKTPIVQPAAIPAPTGGSKADAEARAAINAIRTVLSNVGLTA